MHQALPFLRPVFAYGLLVFQWLLCYAKSKSVKRKNRGQKPIAAAKAISPKTRDTGGNAS
jgi:hypothetical protein